MLLTPFRREYCGNCHKYVTFVTGAWHHAIVKFQHVILFVTFAWQMSHICDKVKKTNEMESVTQNMAPFLPIEQLVCHMCVTLPHLKVISIAIMDRKEESFLSCFVTLCHTRHMKYISTLQIWIELLMITLFGWIYTMPCACQAILLYLFIFETIIWHNWTLNM